ncbi:hypothetical protein FACS1894182_12990 [Bacteroidia bacterium]|nr:hypothetical protein FACS1894182_12990 [Bacteroidia bacterium]
MNRAISISIIILLLAVAAESRGQKQADNNDLIKVDVTKSYSPKKELILQDFTDVEYIVLETNNIFLHQGFVMDIGKKIIIVTNRQVRNGDIFIYDRTGRALRKINRKGQSGEEYTDILKIILDEDNNEMYVNDPFKSKILVYDLYGKFKRSFRYKGDGQFYADIFNYDRDNLICYDKYNKKISFVLVSKQDGSITKEIKIPFNKKILLQQRSQDGTKYSTADPDHYRTIIPFNGNWMLLELSSDTVYTFLPDHDLRPFLVRTPPIQSMDPGVFLTLSFFSDRYIFLETIKNVFDFKTRQGFPKTYFMYDKQEKNFWGYTVYNGDYTTKKEIYMDRLRSVNHETWQTLEAYQLVESYKKGELKGKLREIAAKLDEEDNPVIMLIKHTK